MTADRRPGPGLLLAAGAALVAGIALVVAWAITRGGDGTPPSTDPDPTAASAAVASALAGARPAAAPFADGGFGATEIGVGGRCLQVLVADDAAGRGQGLRDVTDLGPYDGMLFVQEADSTGPFTMAGTPLPLDVTWYDVAGRPVGHAAMQPCPEGSDATCPRYPPPGPYRYALEQPSGVASGGALGPCG